MYKLIKPFMFTTLAMALTMLSPTILAKQKADKGHGYKENKGYSHQMKMQDKDKGNKQAFDFHFSDNDHKTIFDYFHTHNYQYSSLPPGIAKNLARGKPLPPGIAKRYIPNDLAALLGTNPDYEYLMLGNNIVTVARATGIIADILNIGR